MDRGNYLTIPAWVVQDIRDPYHLTPTETMAYSVVYGFSQGGGVYNGSARYMAEWLGCSREYATKVLGKLVRMGLLLKSEPSAPGARPGYKAVENPCGKPVHDPEGCEHSSRGV